MKRYFRIQVAVLCLIAIICGVNSSHVSAKMSNRTVHKKYMTSLLKLKKQLKKSGYLNAQGAIYFCYIDFDHDGIDECMVNGWSMAKDWNGGTDTALYACVNGKVKCIVKVFNSWQRGTEYYYNTKKSVITMYSGTFTDGREIVYKYKKGKKKKIATLDKSTMDGFFINGKKVSESKFEKKRNKLVGNIYEMSYKFKKVTKKNLKKAI